MVIRWTRWTGIRGQARGIRWCSRVITLTKTELIELTGKIRCKAQIRVLTFMRIPFGTTPTGEVKVLRSDLIFCGGSKTALKNQQEPDFDSI